MPRLNARASPEAFALALPLRVDSTATSPPALHESAVRVAADARTIVVGVDLGGLAAVTTALRRPDAFGHAVALSGAVWAPSAERAVRAAVERAAPALTEFHLVIGSSEGAHRRTSAGPRRSAGTAAALLAGAGFRVTVGPYPGGDGVEGWRRAWPIALGEALAPITVLPPPAGAPTPRPPGSRAAHR